MKGAKGWLIAIPILWLAGAFQEAVAYQLSLAGVAPDFLLVGVVCLCLFAPKRNGAGVGLMAGAIHGAIAGGHMAAYAITRTLVGFAIGWFASLEFEANTSVAFVMTAMATLATQLTFFLMNPRGGILASLLATIGSAMYNGVLAIPLYALLNKVLDSPRR